MFGRYENLYYFIVILSLIYLIRKYYKYNIIYWFIILLFYDGLFAYFGTFAWNLYKAFLPVLLVYSLFRAKSANFQTPGTIYIRISFFLFIISFITSSAINGDGLTLVFSQFAKYFILFLSVFLLMNLSKSFPFEIEKIGALLFELLIIQGLMTIVKFTLFGVMESPVGTIAYNGGASGTVLPIIGFVFLWVLRKGALNRKDWLVVGLFLFIGFASMKRAVWFIIPIVIFLLNYYVPGRKLSKKVLYIIPIIPLVFYFGVRFNPTLNPEYQFGGTFDFNYVIQYSKDYTFGKEKDATIATGRGGATSLVFNKFINPDFSSKDIIGIGLAPIYAADIETYADTGLGINHRGSATGLFQTYISSGFIGILTTLIFALSILLKINNRRFRNVIIAIFFWEYFYYTGIILRTPSLSFLLLFSIIYYNYNLFKERELLKPEALE